MKKKSISDQCLVARDLKNLKGLKYNVNRLSKKSRSEEKINIPKSKLQFTNFVKPSSLFKFKKIKQKFVNKSIQPIPELVVINENNQRDSKETRPSPKKNSIILQATALVNLDDYSDLNEKIEALKMSMMQNLNKLIERDASLMDLQVRADNLNKDTFELNVTSGRIKKWYKFKKLKNKIILFLFFLVFILVVCLYFWYENNLNNRNIESKKYLVNNFSNNLLNSTIKF